MKRAVVALLFALVGTTVDARTFKKIAADTAATDAAGSVQVIIQWAVPIGPGARALIVAHGGKVVREFQSFSQGVYVVPASALAALDSSPMIKYVSNDRPVHRKLAYSAAAINAQAAWSSGYTGQGIGVAILDSGVNPSADLGVNGPAQVGPVKNLLSSILTSATGAIGLALGQAATSSIVYTQDFTGAAPSALSYGADWYGHGQHIAGIIASNGRSSSCKNCTMTMVGIAPGASLIDLKVLDENGEGTDSSVIAAVDQAIQLQSTYNLRVMNMSLGRPVFESYTQDPLCQAVEAAWKAGIVVVVAAGNEGRDNSFGNAGYGTITAPGNDPYVLTVGAMKAENTMPRVDDLIASYSSKGPTAGDLIVKPDIVAPGNLVVSLLAQHGTLPLTTPQNAVPLSYYETGAPTPTKAPMGQTPPTNSNIQPQQVNFGAGYSNAYYTLSGTSMATAVVSGAVADLLQAAPRLTPDQVKVLLMQTAYKTFPTSSSVFDPTTGNVYVDYYDIFTVGAGYLDLQAALNGLSDVPTSGNSLSPVATYDPASTNVTLVFDASSVWTNQSVWPDKSKWGASTVWPASALSGTLAELDGARSVWGANSTSAESGVFSSKSKWGASATASESLQEAESISVTGEN